MPATTARTRSSTNVGSTPIPPRVSSAEVHRSGCAVSAAEVAFLDSNFPVNVRRAVDIARGFIDTEVTFRLDVSGIHGPFVPHDATTRSACWARPELLTWDSGRSRLPKKFSTLMNKKHQRIDEMFETARKSEQAGIRVTFNLILGYPGETEADRIETFRVMSDICQRLIRTSVSLPTSSLPIREFRSGLS